MASIKDRLQTLRERRPLVDHALRMQEHFGNVNGSLQAGAVTYFAFLSFFPILALSFLVVGWISRVYPGARGDLVEALDQLLPGLIGNGEGEISLTSIEQAASTIALVGLAGLLYAGLGWITAMRDSLEEVFELPRGEQPSFVVGKLRDLLSLLTLGALLLVSVALAGLVSGLADLIVEWIEVDAGLGWLVELLGRSLGFLANILLFFALFKLLVRPPTPSRSLWSGAVLGAIGFELLKALSFVLLDSAQDRPAFQAFGIALVLVVWINYSSRVMMYAAAWAHTSPAARAQRADQEWEQDRVELEQRELAAVQLREDPPTSRRRVGPGKAYAAGGASMLGLMALLRRRRGRDS